MAQADRHHPGNFSQAHELLSQARQAQIAAAQQARALRQRAQLAEDEQLVPMSFGNQGVALMHLAERIRDATMAEFMQIEAALKTVRAGGHAPLTTYYEARLSEALRIRDALKSP